MPSPWAHGFEGLLLKWLDTTYTALIKMIIYIYTYIYILCVWWSFYLLQQSTSTTVQSVRKRSCLSLQKTVGARRPKTFFQLFLVIVGSLGWHMHASSCKNRRVTTVTCVRLGLWQRTEDTSGPAQNQQRIQGRSLRNRKHMYKIGVVAPNCKKCDSVPSGKLTVCYWTWP